MTKRQKKKGFFYISTTNDKYEFIINIFESSEECAEAFGISTGNVRCKASRCRHGKKVKGEKIFCISKNEKKFEKNV